MNSQIREFQIQSLDEAASLRLVGGGSDWPEYFWAELTRSDLRCRARVATFEPRGLRFSSVFREMADAWRGWDGEKLWESLEGELRLSFRMDSLGPVQVEVRLRDVYHWDVRTTLVTESGALEPLAKSAEAFQLALESAA